MSESENCGDLYTTWKDTHVETFKICWILGWIVPKRLSSSVWFWNAAALGWRCSSL